VGSGGEEGPESRGRLDATRIPPPPPHAVRPIAIPIDEAITNLRYCVMLSSCGSVAFATRLRSGDFRRLICYGGSAIF
jgi:hypothetical protein